MILSRSAFLGVALTTVLTGSHPSATTQLTPPGRDVTGTWSGSLTVGGTAQALTLQLHRRAGGKVMGYVLGGTSARTVTGGLQSGAGVTLTLELVDPSAVHAFTIAGTVHGPSLDGLADDGTVSTPIHWRRVHRNLSERGFLFANVPTGGGDPTSLIDLSVVLTNGRDRFVAGGFVGNPDCALVACSGSATSFDETVDASGNERIDIGLATGAPCPGTGALQATFDDSIKLYTGTYAVNDCTGSRTGDLIGAKATRTTSEDAADVLDTFARLAADLEAGAHFAAPYAPFSPDYLHQGATLSDRLRELNEEVETHGGISVDFSRFRSLHTVDEPDVFPQLSRLRRVDFHDRRSATSAGLPVVYHDADTRHGHDELKYLARERRHWVISGNHLVHDLPRNGYSFGTAHVVVPTAGGDIYVSIGPWGAHSGPHTGHLEGNGKADWMGLYAHSLDQLTELTGDHDGTCETGEVCGVSQSDLDARMLDYAAPLDDFEITDVRLDVLHPPGEFYGSDEHWLIRGHVAQYEYGFGHVREVSADLRDAMIAAGYVDPWTVHLPSGNLITGAALVLNKGDLIARPQTFAAPVPGYPGYYTGSDPTRQTPRHVVEFFTHNGDTSRDESFYTWLAPALEAQLAGVLQAEGLNPASFRYSSPALAGRTWMWRAEMALSNQEWSSSDDYSSLFSQLGGWWETAGAPCDGVSNRCDELFAIFPIRKDTAFYDPALYHSPAVSYLAGRQFRSGVPPTQYGEVLAPSVPHPVAGTLVFKWRNSSGAVIGYQGASYLVDQAGRLLRIAWGPVVAAEAAVVVPPVPADTDACNGVTLTCHNHDRDVGNL